MITSCEEIKTTRKDSPRDSTRDKCRENHRCEQTVETVRAARSARRHNRDALVPPIAVLYREIWRYFDLRTSLITSFHPLLLLVCMDAT